MDDAQLISLVGSLGFPIVVAMYLLTRFEKSITQLATSVNEMTTAIARLIDRQVDLDRDRHARPK